MLFLRSTAFNLFFYINILVWMLVSLPLLLMPERLLWRVTTTWSRLNLLALRLIAGIHVEIRGLEHLPDAPVIIAAKHQSAFETIGLLHLFQRPAFILKQELVRLPLFGWFIAKLGMIPIDRKKGHRALRAMVAEAHAVLKDHRQIIIFPEGTRQAPGARPAYKQGIIHLYKELAVPVVPMALNSGLFWPRKSRMRYPGRIIIEFLPAIEAGLDGETFFARMQHDIEVTSDKLLMETAQSVTAPPLSSEVRLYISKITHL